MFRYYFVQKPKWILKPALTQKHSFWLRWPIVWITINDQKRLKWYVFLSFWTIGVYSLLKWFDLIPIWKLFFNLIKTKLYFTKPIHFKEPPNQFLKKDTFSADNLLFTLSKTIICDFLKRKLLTITILMIWMLDYVNSTTKSFV